MKISKFTRPCRLLAVLLAALFLCCSFTGCTGGDDNIPENMIVCNCEGDPYRLFIPKTWNVNTNSGITSAYASMTYLSTVTVVAYAPAQEGETLDAFRARVLDEMSATMTDVKAKEPTPSIFGKVDAVRFEVAGTRDGKKLRTLCKAASYQGEFYLFTYYATEDTYETYLPDVENMLDVFRFDTPYFPEAGETKPESVTAPAGMKLLSGGNVAYRFYVPEAWIKASGTVDAAYFSEDDRSNITLFSYNPDGEISVADYFELCEKEYKKQYADYTLTVSGEETTMGGNKALRYIFTGTVGGVTYQTEQVITIGGNLLTGTMIYIMTYTAQTEKFDSHADDLQACLNAFSFR